MLSPPINFLPLSREFSVKSRADFKTARNSAHLTSSLGLPVLGGRMHCVCGGGGTMVSVSTILVCV